MRKYAQTTLFLLLFTVGVPALASTATDFYLELLRRGTSEVDAGRHEAAVTPLRLAAFGLVDSITHYETAQAYLAVALDRLGKSDEARRAAQRVISAEAVERRYATLPLPPAIRNAFMTVARKTLSAGELTALSGTPQASTAPSQIPVTAPAPRNAATPTRNGGASTPITPAATTIERPRPAPAQASTQQPAATTVNNTAPKPAATTTNSTPPKPAATTTNSTPPRPAATTTNSTPSRPAATTTNSTPPRPAATPANGTAQRPPATTTNGTPPKPAPTTAPKPQQAAPAQRPGTAPATVPTQTPRVDVPARLAAGDRALSAANLPEARRVYRELLTVTTLDRATLIRAGEGLYRARDFAGALSAFRRLGVLKAGEEAYRYYVAVALFETGDLAAARRELATALPFIEITEDVQRYRVKIEGSRN